MSQKKYTLLFQIFGLLALVILLGSTVGDAYAREFVAPTGVSRSDIRSGEWSPQVSELGTLSAAEAPEPQIIQFGNLTAVFRPLYTSVDDPAFHIVVPGGTLAGVGDLLISIPAFGTFGCTGALLPTGFHVLTAGHCVTDDFGVLIPGTTGDVLFETGAGPEIIPFASITVHPDFDGDFLKGNDVAVIELLFSASASVPTYDIDRDGSDDVGFPFDKVGYGAAGLGTTGATFNDGFKREGKNVYDSFADTMLVALGLIPGVDFVPGSVLQYDFDNGLVANDAFDFFFVIPELGLGTDEVNSAAGDSGSPTFDGALITGITSYGITLFFDPFVTPDVTLDVGGFPILDSSFGEFSGDTRVSFYSDFIDGIILLDTPVGGTIIPIDSTALLVAGAHTSASWMIPILVSAVGIGLAVFTVKRR